MSIPPADRLRALVDGSPYYRLLGLALDAAEAGTARVRMAVAPGAPAGQAAHGGMVASVLEAAGALAACSTAALGEGPLPGKTVSCYVTYLAPVRSDATAEGRVLHRGREIVYTAVTLRDADNKTLATASHIYRLPPAS